MDWGDFLRETIRKNRNGRGREKSQGSQGENGPRPAAAAGLDPAEIARFEAKVDRSGGPDACHPWLGATNAKGYGRFRVKRDGRWTHTPAHRYAWVLAKGRIPKGVYPDHECHTKDLDCPGGVCPHRLCCNPRHLARTTDAQNRERARRRRERQRRLAQRRSG
jgi:hypothetical protein